ncbi:hypothetical protein KC959_02655 [Candidatus Saccharibacteria bacterium]|nr:hypothetical protein [Candidatus Saccharibacteria bacterium]
MVDYPTDSESFKLVEGFWYFDRQFYEDLGANFSRIEDPTESGPLQRLRRAAAICVHAQNSGTANETQLSRARVTLAIARRDFFSEGTSALRPARQAAFAITSYSHPALQSYAERSPDDFRRIFRSRRIGEDLVREESVPSIMLFAEMVQKNIARPVDASRFPSDVSLPEETKLVPIFPNARGGSTDAYPAHLTADQLVFARACASYDI